MIYIIGYIIYLFINYIWIHGRSSSDPKGPRFNSWLGTLLSLYFVIGQDLLSQLRVASGKIQVLPRRRDPGLKTRAQDLALQKSEPETR